MKTNVLLNELAKGLWLIDPHQIDAYAHVVQNVLSRTTTIQNEIEKADIEMLDISAMTNGGETPGENEPTKIALVSMIGPVMKYGDWCTYGANDIVRMLDKANNDDDVLGTVFYIDGPGGAVSAINPFVDFAARKKKPIVVLADTACSLHYWTALAVGDYIMGESKISGRFGSVGVVSSFMDAKKHWEKKGFVFHEIYPEESKDKNKVFNLALEGNYDEIKKEHLSPIAIQFQEAVKNARPNLIQDPGVLTGATFTTEKALSLSMIDGIGNMQQAMEKVKLLKALYN